MKSIINFLWVLPLKIIGHFWVFAAIPFRAWARNYVYNYVLQNGIYLKRLMEREPAVTLTYDKGKQTTGWVLKDVHNVGMEGFIKERKVNAFVFYLVVIFIWGWLDDDSNHDTTDQGHIRTYVHYDGIPGERINEEATDAIFYMIMISLGLAFGIPLLWIPGVIGFAAVIYIRRVGLEDIANKEIVYGNTFDLGDLRARWPYFNWRATFIWNNRNTAMNFQYLWANY